MESGCRAEQTFGSRNFIRPYLAWLENPALRPAN
jgi:hypothetical protein